MGFLSKIFNTDDGGEGAAAFGRGQRVSARHAERYANNRRGSGKSLAQQRREHLAAQRRNGNR
jgi:hypothetical protein